ncbi:MAG: hypothetical protein WCQ95_07575 [Bacteroidota bacterium]
MILKKVRTESVVFLLFALANAYPVFSHHFFPTLDGPSHLYNAHTLKDLIFGNEFLSGFIQLNHYPVPNWIGHFIMALSNVVFPAYISEKILLLCYLIGLPFAFRYLIKSLSPNNYLLSYIIFPFCYTYMFLLGFYNFSLALVLLFFTLGYWINIKDKLSFLKVFVLFLLITATYFSHISVYAILGPMMFALLFIDETSWVIKKEKTAATYFRSMAAKTAVIALGFSITAYWAFMLFLGKPAANIVYLPQSEMLRNIKVIEPIIGFIQQDEAAMTGKIFYVLLVLTLVVLFKRWMNLQMGFRFKATANLKGFIKAFDKTDAWIMFSGVMLLGYFVLPDSDGWAGYFSLRILLLFFLFYIVWLALQNIPKFILVIAIVIALFYNIKLIVFRDKVTASLNQTAMQCYNASNYMTNNSTVLTINRSGNWLLGHFSKYLGVDKSIVVLDNNECDQHYFPLIWNTEKIPGMVVDTSKMLNECFAVNQNSNGISQTIDYIFVMGLLDTAKNDCDKKMFNYLANHKLQVYHNEFVWLYKNKK